MLKFSKGGKAINLHEDDLGLLHPDGGDDSTEVQVLAATDQEEAGPS